MEDFETYFSDPVITENDHPRYVKHVLGRIYVLSSLHGYWVLGGGGSSDILTQPALAAFQSKHLKNHVTKFVR